MSSLEAYPVVCSDPPGSSLFSRFGSRTLFSEYLGNDVDNHLEAYSAQVHGTVNIQTVPGLPNYDVIHSALRP